MTVDAAGLLLALVMAVPAGLMGCFAVMRRMTLAADALSHVALPGIGIALAFHFSTLYGAVAMLLFGALVVWGVERRAGLATEAVIGVVFTTALAVGSMMESPEELIDALFGGGGRLQPTEIAVGLALAAIILWFVVTQRHRLVVTLVSPDIARTAGIDVERTHLLYLLMFALTVALGIRYLGVLLMGSLIIIPAATARHRARHLRGMFVIAAAVATFSTLAGTLLADFLHRPTGPVIVIVAAAIFLLSLFGSRS